MGLYDDYPEPSNDGDVTIYVNKEARASGNFREGHKCIFINGMDNKPDAHRQSAVELSLLLMSPIHGVYNKTGGKVADLIQCVADKYQFDGPAAMSAKTALNTNRIFDFLKQRGDVSQTASSAEVMRDILSRNPAALAAFDLLRQPEHKNSPIYAHSQGNIILANALSAIAAVDGPAAIAGRQVNSFGSPVVNWPAGINHQEYAFTGDGVALLAGFDFSFKISKLGVHSHDKNYGKADANGQRMKPEMAKTWLSHGFVIYMQNDPAFVVNRFRIGSWGMTFNMDEKGIAAALVSMGTNLRRVKPIFEHLDRKHNSDADDVAMYYIEMLQAASTGDAIAAKNALKRDAPMRKLLIKVLDEGVTFPSEYKAIAWVKALAPGS